MFSPTARRAFDVQDGMEICLAGNETRLAVVTTGMAKVVGGHCKGETEVAANTVLARLAGPSGLDMGTVVTQTQRARGWRAAKC